MSQAINGYSLCYAPSGKGLCHRCRKQVHKYAFAVKIEHRLLHLQSMSFWHVNRVNGELRARIRLASPEMLTEEHIAAVTGPSDDPDGDFCPVRCLLRGLLRECIN